MSKAFYPSRMFTSEPWLKLPYWLIDRDELSSADKHVYAELMNQARERSYCWPFMNTLAKRLNMEVRTVERSIHKLEENGLVKVERAEDRYTWSREELGRVETSGNRYFLLAHPWIPIEYTNEDPKTLELDQYPNTRQNVGTPPDKMSVTTRQNVGTPPDKMSVTLIKRSDHQTDSKDQLITASPSGMQSDRSDPVEPDEIPDPPEQTNLPEQNGLTKDAATAELDKAEVRRAIEARKPIDLQAIADLASGKRNEAHAQKQGKKAQRDAFKKDRAKQEQEMGFAERDALEKKPRTVLFDIWREELKTRFPDSPVARIPSPKEYGQLQTLLDKYEPSEIELTFAYTVRNWPILRQRFFKKDGGSNPVPTMGVILALDSQLFPQAVVWEKNMLVVEEYEDFAAEGVRRPSELTDRYVEAAKQLQAIGLKV